MLEAHCKAHIDFAHKIAGIEPTIARLLHVLNNLAVGRLRIGVTIERRFIGDFAKQQPRLTGLGQLTMPSIVPHNSVFIHVVFNQRNINRRGPNGAVLIQKIKKGDIAFTGTVNLANAIHVKAGLELIPYVRP